MPPIMEVFVLLHQVLLVAKMMVITATVSEVKQQIYLQNFTELRGC